MSPNLAMISDGKKFMWDGHTYDNKEEANAQGRHIWPKIFRFRSWKKTGSFRCTRGGKRKKWRSQRSRHLRGGHMAAGTLPVRVIPRYWPKFAVRKVRSHGMLSVRKLHALV